MISYCPRIVISALRGGSGKTLVSIGLSSAFREKGYQVITFKKGPDFIDPGWLSLTSGRKCFNLDPFLMDKKEILHSFISNSTGMDIAIVEGNRGLYDGMDMEGKYSTAELAKLINAPLLLILDVTMATRTIAAVLKGCQVFDSELKIKGVILNRVAGARQEKLIRDSIKHYCGIPVLGAIPKLKENLLTERHMGLVPHQERKQAERVIFWARDVVKKYLDISAIEDIAKGVSPLTVEYKEDEKSFYYKGLKIGFFLDKAFWFYYPENLDALKNMGAELVKINALEDKNIPDVDAIYIGGGFPETQAEFLANNKSLMNDLRNKMEKGLPVYAECGGLMYLGESLFLNDKRYPMVGFLPIRFFLEKKPQGHGYTIVEVCKPNLFFDVGNLIKGHEFHYSRPEIIHNKGINFVFKIKRGKGIDGKWDGIYKKNVLATYTHIHARGNNYWAKAFLMAANTFKKGLISRSM